MGYIYVLKNKINDKMYVGQSVDSIARLKVHKSIATGNYKKRQYIHNAIKEYGFNNFKVYNYYVPNEMMDIYEKELIKVFNTMRPNGYNLTEGGATTKGFKHSEKTKEKISKINKGNIPWNKGKSRSEECKRKISEKLKGRYGGDKNPNYGRKHTKEEIEKMKNRVWVGKKHSEETKKKMSDSAKGRKLSQKTKDKLSKYFKEYYKTHANPFKGKKHSEETKIKMRLAKRG